MTCTDCEKERCGTCQFYAEFEGLKGQGCCTKRTAAHLNQFNCVFITFSMASQCPFYEQVKDTPVQDPPDQSLEGLFLAYVLAEAYLKVTPPAGEPAADGCEFYKVNKDYEPTPCWKCKHSGKEGSRKNPDTIRGEKIPPNFFPRCAVDAYFEKDFEKYPKGYCSKFLPLPKWKPDGPTGPIMVVPVEKPEAAPVIEECGNCKWWTPAIGILTDSNWGYCQCKAPTSGDPQPNRAPRRIGVWPATIKSDACGEFRKGEQL